MSEEKFYTSIAPYQEGDKVIMGSWFGLGEVVHGMNYEYMLEDFRGKVVTIKNVKQPEQYPNTFWYKIEEMPFTISHQMIARASYGN